MIDDFAEFVAGQEIPLIELEIDRLALIKYAGAADDYVRQHWDHPYMIQEGYPDVIGHGWLTFAHMCRAVTDWVPLNVGRITSYKVRYQKPFHPGRLSCGGSVETIENGTASLALWARNASGEILATGAMTLARSG